MTMRISESALSLEGDITAKGAVVGGREMSDNLPKAVNQCLNQYFGDLGGMTPPPGLHGRILEQVEKPLIEHVLRYVKGNQLRAARVLGINRNTLRKKMRELNISVGPSTTN